jgi:SAM-dependent methyltransferase
LCYNQQGKRPYLPVERGEHLEIMSFRYDEEYFRSHYSTSFYRRYIAIRNEFIRSEITKLVPSGKLLEVGFGDGSLIKSLESDFDVFGVDISELAVREITQRYPSAHFTVCDISKEKVPFDETFEIVCAINTVEHLEHPRFALQNIFGLLKRGGIFAVYLPTQSNIFSRIQYKILYDVKEHVFRPSVKFLRNLLTGLGFRLYKEYAASFLPLKLSSDFFLQSFNLYFGLWEKTMTRRC